MKNFQIGKEINRILAQSNVPMVEGKVFPLVATPKTTFPFVVYRRISYQPRSTKDYLGERVGIEINVAAEKYEEGVTIANAIADALQGRETPLIERIDMTNASEIFLQDTFVQSMQFQITLK